MSRLVISLDGMSQQTIEKYRVDCDFDSTIKGIESLCQQKTRRNKNKPLVKVRFLVFKHNEHEIPEIVEFCRRNYVDELALVRPILDWGHTSLPKSVRDWLATNQKYRRYAKDGSLKSPKYCTSVWSPVITWQGDVLPCCYDTNGEIVLGNALEQSFHDIYWSQAYMRIREKMARKLLGLCAACKRIEAPEIETFAFPRIKGSENAVQPGLPAPTGLVKS